ncbi:MAG TPA: protoporphyrinogen oxidase [Deltaproteobacteria bacterium]|nr:protoporphyrinogen oxidase [Candidatus Binatota bacterium]HIL14132.1 protoporphyrinogen oxidase [Deltaproteobacteria bacterium]
MQALVVGAGISGLATAWYLQREAARRERDLDITVLEADDRVGGVINTENVGGFTCELGPDSFISEKPWALALCHELGLEQRVLGTGQRRRSFIARGHRLHPIPDGFQMLAPTRLAPFLTTPLFSPLGKLRMGMDLLLPRGGQSSDSGNDETLAEFVRRRLGNEALERAAQPLVGGIYTSDPEKLSLEATMPRFIEMERKHRSLILGMYKARRAMAPANTTGPRYDLFVSLADGMGELPAALVKALPHGCVRTGQRVESLRHDGDGYLLGGPGLQLRADALCLALPSHASGQLTAGIAAELTTELNAIDYASTATINLAFARRDVAHPLDGFGFVVPAVEGRTLLACTFSHEKFPGRAPSDQVLLRAFAGGAMQPGAALLDDEQLLAAVTHDLSELLGLKGPPLHVRISRHPRAMAQYGRGHLQRVDRIEKHVEALPGLALAGNGYRGIGIPDCVHSAELAAERMAAHLFG